MPSAQEPREKVKIPRRSPGARSGDAIRVSAKDGESYAEILKAMKAKVDPKSSGVEVLSIRITRRKEILLVRKRVGDVSARSIRRSGRRPMLSLWSRRGR